MQAFASTETSRQSRSTRRRFLAAGAVALGGIGLYTWRVEPHWIEIVERDLPFANLPATLQNRTFVQISDLHAGDSVDSDYLIDAMMRVTSLKPAFTVITGDFMTCDDVEHVNTVGRILGHLQPGPLGCFAILGNHDYGMGWAHKSVAEALSRRLSDVGIHVLRNEGRLVGGMQIVGLDDLWSPCFRPDAIIPYVDWTKPALTLCHNPDAVDRPSLAQCRGWILSGHTHGGQCKAPFLPPPCLPVKNRRYTSGEFDVGGNRRLYINRGLGHMLRARFNARPEITVFHLRLT